MHNFQILHLSEKRIRQKTIVLLEKDSTPVKMSEPDPEMPSPRGEDDYYLNVTEHNDNVNHYIYRSFYKVCLFSRQKNI